MIHKREGEKIPVCVQLQHSVLGAEEGFIKRWWTYKNDHYSRRLSAAATATSGSNQGGAADPVTGWQPDLTAKNYLAGRPARSIGGDPGQQGSAAAAREAAVQAAATQAAVGEAARPAALAALATTHVFAAVS